MAQLDPMEEAAVLPAFHDERYEFNAPKVGDWNKASCRSCGSCTQWPV